MNLRHIENLKSSIITKLILPTYIAHVRAEQRGTNNLRSTVHKGNETVRDMSGESKVR